MDKLFCDLKTDEEKSAFFLTGRGYETGVIAQAIQNDVAMAYHRCAEYKKELEALQSKDREDAERYRWLKANGSMAVDSFAGKFRVVDAAVSLVITDWVDSFDEAIDHARRIGGEGE